MDKKGVVYYEEQFENQLLTFYNGASGYVYSIVPDENFRRMPDRESMWYSTNTVDISDSVYIPNVYGEILKREQNGEIKIIRFSQVSEERNNELYGFIIDRILSEGLLSNPKDVTSLFYQRHFPTAWETAVEKSKSEM